MITLEQFEQIRRMYYLEEKSARQIARDLGCSRQTVSRALKADQPPVYTMSKPRPAPVLGPYQARLDALLQENKRLPKKQRYTAHKLFELIQAEGYAGSEAGVQMYTVRWRKANRRPATFLPLEFEPGQDGQVDWGEAQVLLKGEPITVQVFVMHLCYSRRTFVMTFPASKQEAFFYGHARAFEFFGGVPRRLSYDNLSTAVKPLVEGRIREERRAFIAFRSHYLFESHFCTPNQGHEKGGVEGSVGFSRRNYLVPMPRVASWEELNQQLLEQCLRDDVRVVDRQTCSIGEAFQHEQPCLRPLPKRSFDCCVSRVAHLNGYSQVTYETNRYSVPCESCRSELVLKAYPFHVEIHSNQGLIARHPRCFGHKQDVFDPLHYLFLLEQRPYAFDYAKPMRQWQKDWPACYHLLLRRLRETWPEGRGTKEFVQVLRLHQQYSALEIEQAVEAALNYGCAHFDGVKHCLQHLGKSADPRPLLDLTERPHLANVVNQPVDLASYDRLVERYARA